MADTTRIQRNLERLRAGGAKRAQIEEYIQLESAKSGKDAVEAARAKVFPSMMQKAADVVASSSFMQNAAKNPLQTAQNLAGLGATDTFKSSLDVGKKIAREVGTNPARTVLGAGGSVLGTVAGSRFGPIGAVGGAAVGGAGGEAVGESIDNYLFDRQSRSVGERLGSAATTVGLTAVAPVIGGAIKKAVMEPTKEAVETAAKGIGGGRVEKAFKNLFGKEKDELVLGVEQTAMTAKPVGTSEASGAINRERANLLLNADRATDAVKQIDKRNNIIKTTIVGGIPEKDVAKKASDIAQIASKNLDSIKQRQKATNTLFAASKSNKPSSIASKEINGIFTDPQIAGALKAAGGENAPEALRLSMNIPLTTNNALGRATPYIPSERDITAAVANLTQEIGRNPQVEAVFWRDVFENKLKPLLASKSDAVSKGLLEQFEQRFALFRSGQPLGKKLYSGDISFVQDALSSPQALDDAMMVWKDAGKPTDFVRYARNAILKQVSDADGSVVAGRLRQFLKNTDPNTIDRALGKGFYSKLDDVATAREAIEAAGAEAGIRTAARGITAAETTGEKFSGALIAGATGPTLAGSGNAIGFGARVGAFSQSLFRGVFGRGNSFADASIEGLARKAVQSQSARETYPEYAALAASLGTPVLGAAEYEAEMNQILRMEAQAEDAGERVIQPETPNQPVFDLEAELESIRNGDTGQASDGVFNLERELESIRSGGGQGGPEETAPSMGDERDIAAMLRPSDEIGDLIRQSEEPSLGEFIDLAVDRDDLDRMIRSAIPEEMSNVTKKLTTRNEEGFESRVYRDTKGFRTVGIGFNMDAAGARSIWEQAKIGKSFDSVLNGKQTLTNKEAEALYSVTKNAAVAAAKKLVKNYDKLGVHQQAALQDMVFQLGERGAMRFAQTRALIEKGDFAGAARQMLASANARQTPNRVLRRAYMLQHNVSLAEANRALVKAGKIAAKDSIA